MRFSRYIDNRVLNACIRPQLPKWCGPTTVSEVIQILLSEYPCPHEVAQSMGLAPDVVTRGVGTNAVLKGIQKCSQGRLQTQILSFNTAMDLWRKIKNCMKADEVIYLHENGHHVLLLGYVEEPKIAANLFLQGMECPVTMQDLGPGARQNHSKRGDSQLLHEPDRIKAWKSKRHILLKAEHNIKPGAIGSIGSIIVERDLEEVVSELLAHKGRLHIVRVYKK